MARLVVHVMHIFVAISCAEEAVFLSMIDGFVKLFVKKFKAKINFWLFSQTLA